MFEIELKIEPSLPELVRDLKAAIDEETEAAMRSVARRAPAELRDVLNSSGRSGRLYGRRSGEGFVRYHVASREGEPPANDTFALYRSIRARLTGKREITVEFAEHAKFLDPVFGGYLNRPFIERGLESAVKAVSSL